MLFFYLLILPSAVISLFFVAKARSGRGVAKVIRSTIGAVTGAYTIVFTLLGVTRGWNHPMLADAAGFGRELAIGLVVIYAGVLAYCATTDR